MNDDYKKQRSPQRKWRRRLPLILGLFFLVVGVGLVAGYLKTGEVSRPAPVAEQETAQLTREVALYFASEDGQRLVAETRKINECQIDEDCLFDVVLALISGPESDLVAILPDQVELRSVVVEGSLVSVDFSPQLIAAHPGGTQSELLTIYGLVDTLAVNFPHLRQMRVLVEGAPLATLKGHIDLRQPINPDFSLVKEGPAPVGKITGLAAEREE